MAVGKNYDGSKVAPYVDAEDKVIRVTKEWLGLNVKDRSKESEDLMQLEMVSWTICPPLYFFNDTPEVRRILGLGSDDSIERES